MVDACCACYVNVCACVCILTDHVRVPVKRVLCTVCMYVY